MRREALAQNQVPDQEKGVSGEGAEEPSPKVDALVEGSLGGERRVKMELPMEARDPRRELLLGQLLDREVPARLIPVSNQILTEAP